MSVNDEIGDLASLVGLLLALVTLLTANRSAALDRLRKSPHPTRTEAAWEFALDAGLAVVTALVFLAGLPLWLRTIDSFHPLQDGGAVRSVFVIAWALVVPLVVWQANLARSAWTLRRKIP
jgi:uncharacterized membrane protein